MPGLRLFLPAFTLLLYACASDNTNPVATIADLQEKTALLEPQVSFDMSPQQVIESYQALIEVTTDNAHSADVLRRLADLELEASLDNKIAENIDYQQKGQQESLGAIEGYQAYLKLYPSRSDNDLVLYQLSRAYALESRLQEEQQTLDRIVDNYPESRYMDEVQFRRGENLFVLNQYAESEQAYGDVVKRFPQSQFYEKALYKYGWTRFKQNKNRDALDSFMALLDFNVEAGKIDKDKLTPKASRAEQELLNDVMRVISLVFSYESEQMGLSEYFNQAGNRLYEPLLYQSLGDLYLDKDRIADASNHYLSYVRQYPYDLFSPVFHQKTIDIYQKAGYRDQLLEQKMAFVHNYDVATPFWQKQDEATRKSLRPTLKNHLHDLATHFHAQARLSKKAGDYQVSADWYRRFLKSFPDDPDSGEINFLLAESLFDASQFSNAIAEYEKTAYRYPKHKNSAEAGYAALLTYASLTKVSDASKKNELSRKRIDSALRFGQQFPEDKRAPLVLLQTAEHFFAEKQYQQAADVATQLTDNQLANRKLKKSAWTVFAHSQFAMGQFSSAESAYITLLSYMPKKSKPTNEIRELVAASIYKQGEAARSTGNQLVAAQHFSRLGSVIPESPKRRLAEYDAATAYIELEDWPKSISLLEAFRKRYPKEKQLKSGVTEKLALAYSKNGNQTKAAGEMIALSAKAPPARKQELMWTAAGLYEAAGESQQAVAVYKNYIKAFPNPLDRAIELRYRIAEYYATRKDQKKRSYWLKEIVKADGRGKNQRTDRTRYLAAIASMELIQPVHNAFQKTRLTVPLKKSLKKKKKLMERAIGAYSKALKYQVAEVTTDATFKLAEIYHHFANALLTSQRPKGLDEEALEEYELLLEEQAYPFEEKAIDIHVSNFRRIAAGTYDQSVKNSLLVLGKLMPFRYAREEISSSFVEVGE